MPTIRGITVSASNQVATASIYTKMIAGIPTGDIPSGRRLPEPVGGLLPGWRPDPDMDVYVMDETWGLNEAEIAGLCPDLLHQDYLPDGSARIGFPPSRSLEALYVNLTALQEAGLRSRRPRGTSSADRLHLHRAGVERL